MEALQSLHQHANLVADEDLDVDPETMFLLLSKHRKADDLGSDGDNTTNACATGTEWETYKENVRPLKRGRNVQLLNKALRSQYSSSHHSLLQTRRRMIEAIDEYQGDDPLQPWIDCIKWVQESFPTGGESSGLIVIYEQCVRRFWHDERYKEDLRYLKVWFEYAANCADAQVIFSFLEANQIGQNHSVYYVSYALYLESKNKLKKADEIYSLGIARKAQPLERLETAYRTFFARLTRKQGSHEDDASSHPFTGRSFGTILTSEEASRQSADICDPSKRKVKLQRIDTNKPLSVYKDSQCGPNNSVNIKHKPGTWNNLGSQSDRNKENSSIPSKWVAYKVPQKTGARPAGPSRTTSSIEVFVDEDCSELPVATQVANKKPSKLQLGLTNTRNIKKETEMLKENPLRNFPVNCLR